MSLESPLDNFSWPSFILSSILAISALPSSIETGSNFGGPDERPTSISQLLNNRIAGASITNPDVLDIVSFGLRKRYAHGDTKVLLRYSPQTRVTQVILLSFN